MIKKIKKLISDGSILLLISFLIITSFFSVMNFNIITGTIKSSSNNDSTNITKNIDRFEREYNKDFFGKYYFVNANGIVRRITGQITVKDVVKVGDTLTFTREKIDVTKQAANMIALNDFLNEKNIELLYIQAPFKIDKYNKNLPVGIQDYSNENADSLLNKMASGGVKTLDLRKNIYESDLEYSSLFFKTDHHWKIETAFWAYGQVVDYLNNSYCCSIEDQYTNIDNYRVETYKDWFLGSQGKKTGSLYVGVDDFSLIYPKFETQLSLNIPRENLKREGSYFDTVYFMKNINVKNYFESNPYKVYFDGSKPLIIMKNEMAPSDKKILVVKDSFANPLQSYLALCFQQVNIIDLRSYTKDTLKEYINHYNPDLVLFLYNPAILSNMKLFTF